MRSVINFTSPYFQAAVTAVTNLTSGVYFLLLDNTCFEDLILTFEDPKIMRIYGSRICQKLLLDFLLLAPIIAKADFPLDPTFFW